ncbi:MAG: EAL domain-containing protein [Gammaproteobacteria bacterium]|nr:EAL domain-containing protein [Gammaproteobacteria bacterium]
MGEFEGKRLHLLLVEDQPAEVELIEAMLAGHRDPEFHIEHHDNLTGGLKRLRGGGIDLVLLDLCLPDSAGLETFQRLHAQASGVPIILMTNLDDEDLAARAVREGAQDYLIKRRVDTGLLVRSIRYALERQLSEEALRQSEERYALAVRGANDGVWDWNMITDEVYYSPRWKAILGHAETEIGSHPDEWLTRIHLDDFQNFNHALQAHLTGETEQFTHEYRLRHQAGHFIWVLSRGLGVRNIHGDLQRMAGSLTDITARKNAEEQLIHDALHDALTGLPNRTLLLDRLDQALKQLRSRGSSGFAVLFLDLDRFKNVNDSLGHNVGDQLLVEFAQRLSALLRPGDTVARLGGDEFALLISDIEHVGQVTAVAKRILELSRDRFHIAGHEVFTTTSVGIAMGSRGYQEPEEILRDADIAMYRAKGAGKARYEVFDRQMHQRVVELLRLETDLRRAVERGEFAMHYQPIVSLDEGNLVGFEGLIRWHHPLRGMVGPESFIPAAEETGLIVPIGWWTIRETCRQTRQWQREFPNRAPLSISVNVSGRLFKQPDMVTRLERILDETGLSPSSLRIEITESVLLDHAEEAMEKLSGLRNLGVGLHVDDFGTGYSSLSYLQKFAYDSLKIDRSFVHDIEQTKGSGAIVQTIIALGQMLGMNIIAEGVETPVQLRRLQELQCPQVQGFWFSRPLDAAGARRLLSNPPTWQVEKIA